MPYDLTPTHRNTGFPSTGPASEPRCVTAAITNSDAIDVSRKPPRNSHGSGPSGVKKCRYHISAPSVTSPRMARRSIRRPLSRSGPRIDRVRPPHHRERRPEQQSARPCDRRQVQRIGLRDATVGDRPVRLRSDVALPDPTLVVQQRHRDRDHQGGDGEPLGHAEHTTCPDPQQHHHHQRPQQVELLLDGEAPEVAQRREVPGRAVSLPDPDLVPVRDVEQPAQHVATQFAERVRSEDRRVRDQHEHHHEQRREQPASTPHPEMSEMDAAGALLLGDQQQRDQVATDDEEDLHAQEPAGQPLTVGVVDHHRHDCERAHAVESREVRDTTDV